jgi:hypothetical protein
LGFNARIWHSNLSSFCMAIKGDVLCFQRLLEFVPTIFVFSRDPAGFSGPSPLPNPPAPPGATLPSRHVLQSGRSCPSADGYPETMKMGRQWTDVARASRPLWHGHPARAGERDAPATAGETPAPRFSEQKSEG